MKFKEIKPKYQNLEIYTDKNSFSLLEIPQKVKFDFALSMFSEREVLYIEDHDDRQTTEVLVESNEQYLKKKQVKKN